MSEIACRCAISLFTVLIESLFLAIFVIDFINYLLYTILKCNIVICFYDEEKHNGSDYW